MKESKGLGALGVLAVSDFKHQDEDEHENEHDYVDGFVHVHGSGFQHLASHFSPPLFLPLASNFLPLPLKVLDLAGGAGGASVKSLVQSR